MRGVPVMSLAASRKVRHLVQVTCKTLIFMDKVGNFRFSGKLEEEKPQ